MKVQINEESAKKFTRQYFEKQKNCTKKHMNVNMPLAISL